MTYKEALEYIDGTKWFGAEPSLRRIDELLKALGDPQKKLKFVHIAGTNGKGSCAAMVASVLRSAHYCTGLYTSPYLFRFNERIQVNGRQISDDALAAVTAVVKTAAEKMKEHPTEFELITACAMLHFAAEGCDIVVLETGLGGRFDATNIIGSPECSVIMNIGLDHTAILGDTVDEIAAEKAGIIKPDCPCVLYHQAESVENIIREKCRETGSELVITDESAIASEFDSLMGQSFSYKGVPYALSLLGSHQLRNAAAAIETVNVLIRHGWRIDSGDIEHGLYAVSWPARFELCRNEPDFIVDGGHNPQCAETVVRGMLNYYPDCHRVLLVGMMRDKDYEELCRILGRCADEFVAVEPDSPRALDRETLAQCLHKSGKPVTVCDSIQEAVSIATELAGEDGVVCAAGSLYLAGSVRYCLGMY